MKRPMPVFVIPRPQKICTASCAVSWAHRVLYIFRNAIWPASFVDCSLYDCKPKTTTRDHVSADVLMADAEWERKGVRDAHHVAHLVGDVLEPVLHALRAGDHLCDFASDDGLRAERLPEGLALLDPPGVSSNTCQTVDNEI